MTTIVTLTIYVEEKKMKTIYESTAIMLVIFGLCFIISTLGHYESDFAISEMKVIRYGFPMTWLKATTIILPPSPTQYTVLWFELFSSVIDDFFHHHKS